MVFMDVLYYLKPASEVFSYYYTKRHNQLIQFIKYVNSGSQML